MYVARSLPGELAAVVELDDQRGTDGVVQSFQSSTNQLSGFVFQRHALDDVAAGEIADVQDVWVAAINWHGWLPDVSCPDGAGCGPGAGDHGAIVELLTEIAAEAPGDLVAVAVRDVRKVSPQGARSNAWSEDGQLMPELRGHGRTARQGATPERCWRQLLRPAVLVLALPRTQACWIQIQFGRDVAWRIAGSQPTVQSGQGPTTQTGFACAHGALRWGSTDLSATRLLIVLHGTGKISQTVEMTLMRTVIDVSDDEAWQVAHLRRFFWRRGDPRTRQRFLRGSARSRDRGACAQDQLPIQRSVVSAHRVVGQQWTYTLFFAIHADIVSRCRRTSGCSSTKRINTMA